MSSPSVIIETHSARETRRWARRLATLLTGGELIALTGDLGAGKTCFVKGLARGLDLTEDQVLSPTFTMIQEHRGRLPLFHIDLYRLERVALDDLGLREYLFSDGVAAVEWFERLREAPDLDRLSIAIAFAGATGRRLVFTATGARYAALLEDFTRRFT